MSNYEMSVRSIWRKMVTWGFNKKTLKWTAVFLVLKWVITLTLVAYLIRIEKWHFLYWLIFPAIAVAFIYYNRKRQLKR
ncbi:MAG: hypothetical protein ACI8SE_000155 [Bacteroidia bacterium]|jgi:hypothetical protein